MKAKNSWRGAAMAALLVSTPALAEPRSGLAEAQEAYAAVDYETTRTLAKAGIERGGNDLSSTAELYLLWATAAAALDRADEARVAFSFALAANPTLKLDRNLSPKMRGPYLEARGKAHAADGRSALGVTIQRREHELFLVLRDHLGVASTVELSSRASEQRAFAARRFPAAPSRRVGLPDASALEVYVRVLDAHANVLSELGTPEEPHHLPLVAAAGRPPISFAPHDRDASPVPYYVAAGGLAVLGLAASGAATAMFLRREDSARQWNGPGCEQPGSTRREQCAAVDDRRQNAEHLTIGFAAAGGAFLIGSVVSLLLAPSPSRPSIAVDAGPSDVMLRVRAHL